VNERMLTVDDIADVRAYERERDEFRRRVIDLKKRRRIHVGPFVTLVFENRETVRFQVQEMARAERITSDDAIQAELDVYNPLIPRPGELVATLFIELTSKDELREWLPKLVGIERAVALVAGDDARGEDTVPAAPDGAHAELLTREAVTASVHYIRFRLTPEQVDHVRDRPVRLVLDHPNYAYATEVDESVRNELLADLERT